MLIPWDRLRRMGRRGKMADCVIVVQLVANEDGSWKTKWHSAHWLEGVGDELPPNAAAAAAGALGRTALRARTGDILTETLTGVAGNIIDRLNKE